MQRERMSIPRLILFGLWALFIFVVQTSVFGAANLFGYHVDLLPAAVAAAALLSSPAEGAVLGVIVGVLYDIGTVGIDGLMPIFFFAFGYGAGALSRLTLRRNYLSMLMLTAGEMLTIGLLRYLFSLMQSGARFLPVLRQIVGGTLLACVFCFIVYLPMRQISRKFER